MTSPNTENCPLCGLDNQTVETSDGGERKHVVCERCGEFRITTTAAARAVKRHAASALSAWLRSRRECGAETPEISSQNLDEILASLPAHTVLDKQALLLNWLAGRSKYPGDKVEIDPNLDYPVSWCDNTSEFEFYIESLVERDLVNVVEPLGVSDKSTQILLTPAGWSHLEESNRPRAVSNQAFVAMAFAESMHDAWEKGIKQAAIRAGYRPYRTDAQPSIDRIDVQIMAEIRRSHFVIADVTLQRPGVYFEAGYAIGLGIPVYWCVREDELEKVHFDTRQYSHIVWSTPSDLSSKLYDFIYALSGPSTAN